MNRILLRRPVLAWACYDWANSAFATTVMAVFFPIFFKSYWDSGSEVTVSTFHLGVTNTIASLIVALFAPIAGAVADQGGARIKLLVLFTVLGVAMTASLPLVERGDWMLAAVLFAAASIGFWGGNQFYDSLLLDVAEERNYDLVSGFGYSIGYLGGGLLFAVNAAMAANPAGFGFADAGEAVRASFVMVAVWWAVFSLPVLLFVREKRTPAPLAFGAAVRAGWVELRGTLRYVRADRTLLLFLLAYWFYIDGVNTVMKMAVDYGLALGFAQATLIKALLIVQFVGFPAALAFGFLGKRFGPRAGILIAIAVYAGATVYAYFMDSEREFYALAITVGLVQGGIQSLSRSLYGRLVPEGRSGQFFGFYNMMGKAAAVLGPLLTGVTALLTRDSRLAILSLVILFVIGGVLLLRVPARIHAPAAGSSTQVAGSSR
jgi:MFS transporter, UMF1 family